MPFGAAKNIFFGHSVTVAPPTPGVLVITQYPIEANRVFQEIGAVRAKAFSGTSVGATDTIEARLIDAVTGAEVVAWATKTTAVAGQWAFSMNLPRSNSTYLQVRKLADAAVVTGTSRLGVGSLDLFIGQSNGRNWWTSVTGDSYPVARPAVGDTLNLRRWSGYGWFEPVTNTNANAVGAGTGEPNVNQTTPGVGGNALTLFLDLMRDGQGWTAGGIGYCIGGTSISTWLTAGSSWINMDNTIDIFGGPDWAFEAVVMVGGEKDANDGMTRGTYYADLQAVAAQVRARAANATLPMYVSLLGPMTTATDAEAWAILQAQLLFIDTDPNVFFAWSPRDEPSSDGSQHISVDSYMRNARRYTQNRLFRKGIVGHGAQGPKISGGTVVSPTRSVTLTVTQDGGTTLLDGTGSASGTGLTAFEVQVNGAARGLTSAILLSGTIVLTFDGAAIVGGDVVGVRYSYGQQPNIANVVRDNTTPQGDTVGCPLQPTRDWFTVTATGGGHTPPGLQTVVGPSDNLAAIQAKLNSVTAGNSLVFSAGTSYNLGGNLIGKNGITVWAAGTVNITGGDFDFSGKSAWTIRGVSSSQTATSGFVFDGASRINTVGASGNWTIGNCTFTNNTARGGGFEGSAIHMFTGTTNGRVINCNFTNVAGTTIGYFNWTDMIFDGLQFLNCNQPCSGQWPVPANPSLGNNISWVRCAFDGTHRACLEFGPNTAGPEHMLNLSCINCWFGNFNRSGSPPGDGQLLAVSFVALQASNTTVQDCFISLGTTNTGWVAPAIEFAGSGNVSNNTTVNMTYGALMYGTTTPAFCHDNNAYNNGSNPFFGWINNGGSATFTNNVQHGAFPGPVPPYPTRNDF